MLTQLIFRSSPPQINYFPENTEEQPKQYFLMREETSLFESILNTMKCSTSQSKNDCSNPNCKNVFLIENSDDIDEDEILKAAGESLDTNSGLTVCITAGASTPDDIIEEVKVRMNNTFETNSDA